MKLPAFPSLRELNQIYGLSASKHLSQNYIMDPNIAARIVKSQSNPTTATIEVGPGIGSLTRAAISAGAISLIVVEKDKRFLPVLNQLAEVAQNMRVVSGDIMHIPHDMHLRNVDGSLIDPVQILANLPFNISTMLLVKWLHMIANKQGVFAAKDVEMNLMFQKEVGRRIIASPNTRARSRLTILTQALCKVSESFVLPSRIFVPQPKVDSSIIKFIPRTPNMLQGVDSKHFEKVVSLAFQQRRKAIKNSLGKEIPEIEALMESVGVDPLARAEQLTVEEYVALAKVIKF